MISFFRKPSLWVTLIFSLQALIQAGAAEAPELWTVQPGMTRTGVSPETWVLDFRGKTEPAVAEQARGLSPRLYGPAADELHHPISIKTDFAHTAVLGFHVTGLSRETAELAVKLDDRPSIRRLWERGSSGQRVNTLYFVPLPAGSAEVSLEAARGAVTIDHYFIAKSEDLLPDNLARVAFDSPDGEPEATEGYLSGQDDGYRGIWHTLNQFSEYGDKYSGGLGTYTANHIPLAIYAPEVNKTFFVYGGTVKNRRHLLAMASYYDHERHRVPRPTIVHDRLGVNDPHDNPSLSIDDDGHIWVFVSGRMTWRSGFIYRSVRPFDVSDFERISEQEFTYPQPWFIPEKGFFHLMTKYTMSPRGRLLYWKTSPDGIRWSEDRQLAALGGHYQVSNARENKIATFFNRHPNGTVDRRTDLYYLQTMDFGVTWTTADGTPVSVPLVEEDNPARVIDYASQGKRMYTIDLNFDSEGRPVLLYIVSGGHEAGPGNDPREWVITRWTGAEWESHVVTRSTHNYDLGGLYILENEWRIIGPTEPGPQRWGTGGEIALWVSRDEGRTWRKKRQVTRDSEFNHTYARRPVNARDPFFSFWADGNPDELSASRLYFGNADGTTYWQLPYNMDGDFATPVSMEERSNHSLPPPN